MRIAHHNRYRLMLITTSRRSRSSISSSSSSRWSTRSTKCTRWVGTRTCSLPLYFTVFYHSTSITAGCIFWLTAGNNALYSIHSVRLEQPLALTSML